MLLISMPYKVEQVKEGVEIVIKSLKVSATGSDMHSAMDLIKHALSELVSGKINKESFIFQQNPSNSEKGLLISTHWPDLMTRVLELEPLPETRDAKSERQKRLETQEHLSSLK